MSGPGPGHAETISRRSSDVDRVSADAHLPPKAHRPNGAADTMPMLRPTTDSERVETVREARSTPARGSDLTTVPRGVPRGSKAATFVAALLVVLVLVGGATWFFMRAPSDEPHAVAPAVSQIVALPSAAPIAASPPATPAATTQPAVEPSATATPLRVVSTRPSAEPRPTATTAVTSSSSHVAAPPSAEKPPSPPSVAAPARPSASSRDDLPKDPL